MRVRLSLAIVLIAFPTVAFADLAALTRVETPVLAAPVAGAEVIAVLPPQTEVLVYEIPVNGYRQVQLDDGRRGFLSEASLRQGPAVQPSAGTPSPPGRREGLSFELLSATYVQSPTHLRALTFDDPLIFARADDMSRKHVRAVASALTGGAIGLTLAVLGVFLPRDRCFFEPMGVQSCGVGIDQVAVAGVGGAFIVASVLSYFWLGPSASEMREAVIIWNHRHPDRLLRVLP